MRRFLLFAHLCLLAACGGAPAPAPSAAPSASVGADAPAASTAPNPDLANPADADAIDPSINPCLGAAGSAAAREAVAEKAER